MCPTSTSTPLVTISSPTLLTKVEPTNTHLTPTIPSTMPDIKLRNQPFDLKFHPTSNTLYASLLTGEVKAWTYDDATGEASKAWSVRPCKRTARALAIEASGDGVWMGGKSGVVW